MKIANHISLPPPLDLRNLPIRVTKVLRAAAAAGDEMKWADNCRNSAAAALYPNVPPRKMSRLCALWGLNSRFAIVYDVMQIRLFILGEIISSEKSFFLGGVGRKYVTVATKFTVLAKTPSVFAHKILTGRVCPFPRLISENALLRAALLPPP